MWVMTLPVLRSSLSRLANMHYLHFASIDSTNDYLKLHAHELPHFTVVRADYQTAGRGQFARRWHSNPKENLLLSILLKNLQSAHQVKQAEQILIQALLDLCKLYGLQGKAKAPNDLYVGNHKIAGLLIETKQSQVGIEYLILGMGINVNQTQFLDLPQATSFALQIQQTIDLETFFLQLLERISPLKNL